MATTLTKPDLSGRIKFGYWYNLLHVRLYRRVDAVLTASQLIMGSYVVASAINDFGGLKYWVAIVVAVLGVVQQLAGFQAKKVIHELASKDYLELERDFDDLDVDQVAKKYYGLLSKYPDGIFAVELVAQNIVAELHGDAGRDRRLKGLAWCINKIV